MAPDLSDDLFAFRYGRFEFVHSLAPHPAQVELKHRKQLTGGLVQVVSDTHALVGADEKVFSGEFIAIAPR